MASYWRISDHADLNGFGGRKFSSRWTSMGRRVVYMAESPAGALVEVLVHLEIEEDEMPDEYQLLEISVPENLSILGIEPPSRIDWREHPELTQRIGDVWLASMETPLAHVPSAIMPHTWNILLNPLHPDAKKIEIAEVINERFDNRLFRIVGR